MRTLTAEPGFALKSRAAGPTAAQAAFAVAAVAPTPAAGAYLTAAPSDTKFEAAIVQRPLILGGLVFNKRVRLDLARFDRPPQLRRSELPVPAAPTAMPADTDVFVSPDGNTSYVLPRYTLRFERVGQVEEPSITIADRAGTPTLVVTFDEAPSPAAGDGRVELPHVLTVTLKYRVPVLEGGAIVREIAFPSVLLDASETVVTAELPLTTPGQRQQILAALASLDASATFVIGRGITVGVPTGETLPGGALAPKLGVFVG